MAAGVTLATTIGPSFSWIMPDGSPWFVAEANPSVRLVLRVLGSAASLATILEWLNIRPTWAYQPNYNNAGGCTQNYQIQEVEMRQGDIVAFSGVHRAPANHDVAIMAGLHKQSPHLAEAAVQYGGKDAINLRGRETEAVRAATEYLGSRCRLSSREFAKAIAVTKKIEHGDTVRTDTGARARTKLLETALGGYILDIPGHHLFNGGAVAVHVPGLNGPYDPALIGLQHG